MANSILHTHPNWYQVLRTPWDPIDCSNEPIKFSHKDNAYFLDGRIPDQIDGLANDRSGI